jgi:hypothetical protein
VYFNLADCHGVDSGIYELLENVPQLVPNVQWPVPVMSPGTSPPIRTFVAMRPGMNP